MTKDDIIDMALEAGFVEYEIDDGTTDAFDVRYERFANLVAEREREECAKLIEAYPEWLGVNAKQDISAAIRARGNT
jgi:hypothetical protein